MNITLTTDEKIKITLAPTTASGRPAKLDGAPEWTVTEGDATLDVAEDGLSADIISGDEAGASTVEVTADADLGEGVRHLTETIAVNVTDAEAGSLGFTIGTPVLKDSTGTEDGGDEAGEEGEEGEGDEGTESGEGEVTEGPTPGDVR